MSPTITFLSHLTAPWASIYNNSKLAVTLVTFVHLAGLLVAGGTAVTSDAGTLRFREHSRDQRRERLDSLASVHRVVVAGLLMVAVSGGLMLAADPKTYLLSVVFWTKMALIGMLLANGLAMTRAERRLRASPDGDWRLLRWTARLSLTLWFATLLAGTALASLA